MRAEPFAAHVPGTHEVRLRGTTVSDLVQLSVDQPVVALVQACSLNVAGETMRVVEAVQAR
jgi:hypothetical protein